MSAIGKMIAMTMYTSIELPYYLLSTVTSVPNIYKCDSMTDDEFQANKDFL
jgi:hypothetical protein